jgi:hypothetical protein
MGYYDNIFNLISFVLALLILFIVLFGCQFQKYKYIEKFTDDDKSKTETKTEKEKEAETPSTSDTTSTPPEKGLSSFEDSILKGLNTNSLSDADIQKMIDYGTFTRDNLDNMLNYIQHFKNKQGD